MTNFAAWVLGFGALLGLAILAVQFVTLLWHTKTCHARNATTGISVLKPLCGIDDDLEASLEEFASLPYLGEFELLLGVRTPADRAYPVARAVAERHPGRVRVVLQRGEPGFNPKVNQLITLAAEASHPLLVVSDSNVRVPPNYLFEVAAAFEDPEVGCLSHPVAGRGDRAWGAAMDNLHLASSVGAGMVAAQWLLRKPMVVGKSMVLRKDDLDRLGGFQSVKNILAEDHILGNRVVAELGKRVLISTQPVFNYSVQRSLAEFLKRYLRWSVIHRTAIPAATYWAEALLNPLPLAAIAFALAPSHLLARLLGLTLTAKALLDLGSFMVLGGRLSARSVPSVWIKDLLLFGCWIHGLFARTVVWRGNRLRATSGSLLIPLAPAAYPEHGAAGVLSSPVLVQAEAS